MNPIVGPDVLQESAQLRTQAGRPPVRGDQGERPGDAGIAGVPIAEAIEMLRIERRDPASALSLPLAGQRPKLEGPPQPTRDGRIVADRAAVDL